MDSKRLQKEIPRKAIHVMFGIFFLLIISLLGPGLSLIIMGACMILGILVSFAITRGAKFKRLKKIVEKVERENEKKFPGKAAIYFFASAIILLFIFGTSKTIVITALSVQIFADAAGAIVGMSIGRHKLIGKKTIEGSTAFFLVAVGCISLFYPIQFALLPAIVATIIEALPLDDNLWVPLFTAITLILII